MTITFYGAAGEVTGSKHLVELAGSRILLDCGMVQGRRRDSHDRNQTVPFDPASIEAVVISHAHFDHIGWLPMLVRQGFRGPIVATGATRDLAELILLDAAKIQRQDAEYANRHRWPESELAQPLFTEDDIPPVMERFVRLPYVIDQAGWYALTPKVRLKLYDAGHILGSAVSVLEGQNATGQIERLLYSGDLGRSKQPLLRDPQVPGEEIHQAIVEATYGQRLHHGIEKVEEELVAILTDAIAHHRRIVVPAFSLGRTQQLIYLIHQLIDKGRVPRLPVIVDSPLAERITTAFAEHQRDYDVESGRDFSRPNEDPLVFRNLRFTHTVDESKALNGMPGPFVIISASGMASGGRVMHHLRNLLPDPEAVVLFTGYQADHTPGRRLLKGAKTIQIFGQPIPVNAKILAINDLSAHADADEIDRYLSAVQGLRQAYLVHAEPDRAAALRAILTSRHPDWQIHIPALGQTFQT